MRLIITGGLGHIGAYFLRNLANVIQVDEIIIIDSIQTQRIYSLFNLPRNLKYRFFEKDIRTLDNDFVSQFGKVDGIIHLAAITDAAGTLDKRDFLFENNLESTKKVIQICIANEIPLIFPSTTSVYGSQSNFVDENCLELFPQSPYAECKLEEEYEVISATKRGLKATILRFGTIHGVSPGIRFHTAVNKFCFQVSIGSPISVWRTALNQERPYLSLSDANQAVAHVLGNSLFNGEIYNVLTNNHTVAEIIATIEASTSKKCLIEIVESKIMNQLSYKVSNEKFISTGFDFKGSLRADIRETMMLLDGIYCE